jgi:hypothetical protein
MGAMQWITLMDRTLMAMKGRPFSEKQRNAIIGVLLTLDPDSPFYSPRPAADPRYTLTEAGLAAMEGKG